MKKLASGYKTLWLVVIVAFTNLIFQPLAYSDIISTEQLVAEANLTAKKSNIMNMLGREDIRARMVDMGVDMSDAQNRINSMTEAELNKMSASLETMPAGGDALGAVLTILLIFLILDLAGVTDIFPGV